MKKLWKDTKRFGMSNIMIGGMGIAAGAVDGGAGIAAVGGMMPAVGAVMIGGHLVRLSGKMLPKEFKRKRKSLF